ncbi:hypothetical protein PT300_15025 [Enterobacteriaceae bacterium ESL0689]|nr:hypothetical protein [Enterobacteriaceae bacterium ESL0689]
MNRLTLLLACALRFLRAIRIQADCVNNPVGQAIKVSLLKDVASQKKWWLQHHWMTAIRFVSCPLLS